MITKLWIGIKTKMNDVSDTVLIHFAILLFLYISYIIIGILCLFSFEINIKMYLFYIFPFYLFVCVSIVFPFLLFIKYNHESQNFIYSQKQSCCSILSVTKNKDLMNYWLLIIISFLLFILQFIYFSWFSQTYQNEAIKSNPNNLFLNYFALLFNIGRILWNFLFNFIAFRMFNLNVIDWCEYYIFFNYGIHLILYRGLFLNNSENVDNINWSTFLFLTLSTILTEFLMYPFCCTDIYLNFRDFTCQKYPKLNNFREFDEKMTRFNEIIMRYRYYISFNILELLSIVIYILNIIFIFFVLNDDKNGSIFTFLQGSGMINDDKRLNGTDDLLIILGKYCVLFVFETIAFQFGRWFILRIFKKYRSNDLGLARHFDFEQNRHFRATKQAILLRTSYLHLINL